MTKHISSFGAFLALTLGYLGMRSVDIGVQLLAAVLFAFGLTILWTQKQL